jgi:SAM-dependent methyltransferase
MTGESIRDFYNRQYSYHLERELACPHALHDLAKARRRVAGVVRRLAINEGTDDRRVLDVGCGLGFYTKALSERGASVRGIDLSEAAIASARSRFPECRFEQGSWPEDVPVGRDYDLIWMVNFSSMNTHDVGLIRSRLVNDALARLKYGGHLVLGWNTNFSGQVLGGYSNWSIGMLRELHKTCGFSGPVVVEARMRLVGWCMIRAAYILRKSIPIFLTLRKGGEGLVQDPERSAG